MPIAELAQPAVRPRGSAAERHLRRHPAPAARVSGSDDVRSTVGKPEHARNLLLDRSPPPLEVAQPVIHGIGAAKAEGVTPQRTCALNSIPVEALVHTD